MVERYMLYLMAVDAVAIFQDSETECCTGGAVTVRATVTDFVTPPPIRVTWPA